MREKYLLPKSVTNMISTYIVMFVRHLDILLDKKAFHFSENNYSSSTSYLPKQNQKLIQFEQLQQTLNDVQSWTKVPQLGQNYLYKGVLS